MEVTPISPEVTSIYPEIDGSGVNSTDIAVIAIYFLFILAVGLWAMCRNNRGSVEGFFLAERSMTWLPIGASIFSSNIGSGHFVGLAGTGAASGIAVVAFEWNAIVLIFLLGWIFVPVYISAGVVTMPEYLRERFGGQRIRIYLSILSLILYIFSKVSVDLFAGAIFIQQALNWNLYLAMILILSVSALYTITGGLAAVIYTDTAQTAVMMGGAFVMMIMSFTRLKQYGELEDVYMKAIPSVRPENSSCGLPREDSFSIFRDAVTGDLPWPGLTLGYLVLAVWYWCTDQVIVQRALAAKNLTHAKGGCVFAGFLKISPMYLMVMVGMISRVIFPDEVACVDPNECLKYCGNSVGCSNIAYPKLVLEILPSGLRGLMLAVMMAALMSSLTSVFNSASTLFTCDIWTKVRKNATQRELMIVGRAFILIMVVVSVAWVPIIKTFSGGRLFDYINAVISTLGPPVAVVFVGGSFWPRMNEPGAFWSLMAGLFVGVIRICLEFVFSPPMCGEEDLRPAVLYKVHYLHFGIILAGCTLLVAVVVSLCTPPIAEEHLHRLTWYTRHSTHKRISLYKARDIAPEETDKDGVIREEKPFLKRWSDVFCGLEDAPKHKSKTSITNIKEERIPAIIVNVFAACMLCTFVFLLILYR